MDIENYQGLNYQPLEKSLATKRALYAKMLEKGFQPQKTEMISGIAIPSSKTQGFSDILKVGLGSYLGQKAEDDLLTLQTKKTQDKGRIFAKLMGLPNADSASGVSGGVSLSPSEIAFMQSEMPDIGKSYMNNKFADQRLTNEQKNARDSGFNTPADYWRDKQNYTAKIANNALTNEQKNARASGYDDKGQPLTPLSYQQFLENNKFSNRQKLQDDAQDSTHNENLYDRIDRNLSREDTQKHDTEKMNTQRDDRRAETLVDSIVTLPDGRMIKRKIPLSQKIEQDLQKRRIAAGEAVNPFRGNAGVTQNVPNDVVRSNQALVQNGGGLVGNVANNGNNGQPQPQPQKPEPVYSSFADDNGVVDGEVVQNPANKALTQQLAKLNAQQINNLRNKYPTTQLQTKQALQEIDNLLNTPDLDNYLGSIDALTPDTSDNAIDFQSKNENLKNKAFVKAYETLRGAQGITDLEGSKGTDAIAMLSRYQSPKQYKEGLRNLRDILVTEQGNTDKLYQQYATDGHLPRLNIPPKVNLKDLSNDDLLKKLYE